MIKFVSISALKNGKNKYSFSQLGICKILKEELDFRFKKVGTKGLYLIKNNNNGFDITDLSKVIVSFLDYVENEFDKIEDLKGTSFEEFKNAFHAKNPIKNSTYCSDFLSQDFELDPQSLHVISMQVDKAYKYKHDLKNMLAFLEQEEFKIVTETKKKFRYDELFCYKQISDSEFIIFHRAFTNRDMNEPIFDCWLFATDTEQSFSRSKMDFYNKVELKLNFDLETDLEIYNNPVVE